MEDDFATEFVSGNIDRETKLKINSFPSPGMVGEDVKKCVFCFHC